MWDTKQGTGTAGAGFYCQLYNHAHTTHTIIYTWLVEGHIEKLNRIICVNVDKVVTRKNFIIIIISDVFILTSVNNTIQEDRKRVALIMLTIRQVPILSSKCNNICHNHCNNAPPTYDCVRVVMHTPSSQMRLNNAIRSTKE